MKVIDGIRNMNTEHYVSPVFDITDMYNFADNNFVLQVNVNKQTLCSNMEIELAKLVKWLRGCGLKVDTNSTPC